ncbi:chromatin remodelling complex Rsc7/Swp82 subunit-domain-containing protein [Massariosphaeria phaeospora]|uniref:Chromatin remodelling complex Rsc7/Swp82 subunit-domain-containing protein n=1 Tax=Massariosphaeria phaeospora TaxID=100035 RepID=A0A7C8M655_9PLEO|nr:chromatin remodelling complex Rsc7/Swp82 subunit-domain-containing protein [Massariosphaeria phaeospora]
MYSMHPVQTLSNGGIANGIMDPSGTINPAALGSAGVLVGPPQPVAPQASRGIKRSRSPENGYGDVQNSDFADGDEGKPRKRGRPPKTAKVSFVDSPNRASQAPPTPSQLGPAPPVQTPLLQSAHLPQSSPPQPSPSKATPTKTTVIKALPTVRDHTTDQLNPEGDEYLPREIDEAGERKVTATGHPLDGREYRCRTFFVPNRGDKLFMLATECARVLGYRDSYLLFNKNRSLYKIIATQAEKDDLIHQEILPYSYRSRQIAIVTARSMFRQFGSRLIVNGRRVRDDYWESKARKQGFTEEDAAGEKRPGAAKAREAAAAEANAAGTHLAFAHTGGYTGKLDQDYLGTAGVNPLQPFGGLHAAPGTIPAANTEPFNQRTTTDLQPRDYNSVQRPRQDLSGVPFQDMSRPTASGVILTEANQSAEFNKQLEQQRKNRKEYLDNVWHRPQEPPAQANRPRTAEGENVPQVSQAVQSPRIQSTNTAVAPGQYGMTAQTPQRTQTMPQAYRPQPHPQGSMVPSPMAQQHTQLRPDQMHRRPPSMGLPQGMAPTGMAPTGMLPANPGHGYAPPHMWPQGPPQPSPLSQQHNMQQYAQRPPQQSPHPQQSPMHASPQLHHIQSSGSMHNTPVQQYQTMGTMADQGYPMGQNPYQPSPSPHQFMQHQSTAAQQPGMPGWAPNGQAPQQGWQSY